MLEHKFKENEAVARVKTDLEDKNVSVRDWPAFRIIDEPKHPLVKNKYVWPLLDFASAIDDHLMNVTHIIRGIDLQLSKNGGVATQKNDANPATHRYGGNYSVPFNATDVNTLGQLDLMCKKSGALPITKSFEYAYLQALALEKAGYETYLIAGVSERQFYPHIPVVYRGWDFLVMFKDEKGRTGIMENNQLLAQIKF